MIRRAQQRERRSSRLDPMLAAVLVHGVLLLTLLRVSRVAVAPMRLPGTARGTHVSLTYLPGRAPETASLIKVAAPQASHKALTAPKPKVPATTSTVLSTDTPSSTVSHPDATSGNDALGTGDVNIALATSFPAPKPDLSSLPHGTSGDVVLDIVIDAAGKVSSITMSRGLGHGIDEIVIATVQGWSFHPATRDGQPVPSEQELHFHYEKA